MMLNPFALIFTLLARLLGTAVPQYRPPSQPPAIPGRVVELRSVAERGEARGGPWTAGKH